MQDENTCKAAWDTSTKSKLQEWLSQDPPPPWDFSNQEGSKYNLRDCLENKASLEY